jgi:hypothetical protein
MLFYVRAIDFRIEISQKVQKHRKLENLNYNFSSLGIIKGRF